MIPSEPFRPLDLGQLRALELPTLEWVVDGILPRGHACLLTAREKAGKGLLTIDLCASVAGGEPFLDRAVLDGPAIYCAAEENIRDVRQRIEDRLGNLCDARGVPLYVLPLDGSTPDRLKLNDPVGMQRFRDMIEDIRPVVVVLDTLRELHDLAEDKSDDMAPLLAPLRQIAHQTNTSVVVNHHQNKAGTSRGSTAIRAAFDLEWAFRRDGDDIGERDDATSGVLVVEGRHGPRTTLRVVMGDGLRWRLATPLLVVDDPTLRNAILAWLVAHPEGGDGGMIAEGVNRAKKTVQNELSRMKKESPLPFAWSGNGPKGAAVYRALTPALFPAHHADASGMVPSHAAPMGHREGRNQDAMLPSRPVDTGSREGRNHPGASSDHASHYSGNHGIDEGTMSPIEEGFEEVVF